MIGSSSMSMCLVLGAPLLFLWGCASAPVPVAESGGKPAMEAASCDRGRDHAVIMKLAGEFWVDFHFEETIPLQAGYTPNPAYETAGRELVVVVEDSPARIVLQHILVVETGGESKAIKHWREDWQFEDDGAFEYRGRRTWERRKLPLNETRCHWSQAVFEVDDEPRYEAVGRFRHVGEVSTWTSNVTWRPLPRREYTKRSDYDVLVGINRVTVTPDGWAHEQDNEKLRLSEPQQSLVREIGINRYIRSPDPSLKVASAYWQKTSPYWSLVREEWSRLTANGRIELAREVEGKTLTDTLLALAETAQGPDLRTRIHSAIAAFVTQTPQQLHGSARNTLPNHPRVPHAKEDPG